MRESSVGTEARLDAMQIGTTKSAETAAQLVVEIDGPPSLFPPAEPAAASRICTASRHLHRHYRMRRKRRAARRWPPSGGPQFNVRTLARLTLRIAANANRLEKRQHVVGNCC